MLILRLKIPTIAAQIQNSKGMDAGQLTSQAATIANSHRTQRTRTNEFSTRAVGLAQARMIWVTPDLQRFRSHLTGLAATKNRGSLRVGGRGTVVGGIGLEPMTSRM